MLTKLTQQREGGLANADMADKEGRGGWGMVTSADQEGRGGLEPPHFWLT